jgi:hypothetical protein
MAVVVRTCVIDPRRCSSGNSAACNDQVAMLEQQLALSIDDADAVERLKACAIKTRLGAGSRPSHYEYELPAGLTVRASWSEAHGSYTVKLYSTA